MIHALWELIFVLSGASLSVMAAAAPFVLPPAVRDLVAELRAWDQRKAYAREHARHRSDRVYPREDVPDFTWRLGVA